MCGMLELNQIITNLSSYSLHYAEACNEFAGARLRISTPVGSTFEEMLQQWRAVGNSVSDLSGPRFEPPIHAPSETSALSLYQLWCSSPELIMWNNELNPTLLFFCFSSATSPIFFLARGC